MAAAQLQDDLKGLSPVGLVGHATNDFAPPLRQTVSAYAADHRFLFGAGGGNAERWHNDKTPYLVEPMDDLDSGHYLTVALVGPGQVGKTVVPENWLLKSIATDPANTLWYMQSDEALEAYVKDRINPMIDGHDVMSKARGMRLIDDSLHYKRFRGMSVQFLTASMSNLISKSAPRIVADEIDGYRNIFGDVKVLLDVRRQTFGDASMLLAISHPDKATGLKAESDWNSGIMSMYRDSTRCMWYWQCPHCGCWSSPCPIAPLYMSLEYPTEGSLDEVQAGAYLLCPSGNGCVINDEERLEMNRTGVWVGEGQTIDRAGGIHGVRTGRTKTAGYWIVGTMSPFVLEGIGGLARARVKAERESEATGEDDTLRQVIVKQWGIPYAPQRALGSIDANDLAERAEPTLKLGEVPDGVRFITIAVDCQLSHFEWLVRGWGKAGESWIIARGKTLAETSTSAEDWDKLLDLFATVWPLADGSGRGMVARAACIDSGGAAGVTQQAYTAWTRWRKNKKLSKYGLIGGREAWSIILSKGATGFNAAKLAIVYPDTARKASKFAAGEVPLALFNPNQFKDDLSGQLQRAEPGPWFVHYPYELRSKEPPHVWFEQAVSERRLPNGRWEKLVPSARNETLDLLVMSHITAHLHGLTRINWEKPPAWAAPWDTCTLVSVAPGIGPDGKKTGGAAPAAGAVKVKIDPKAKKSISSRLA